MRVINLQGTSALWLLSLAARPEGVTGTEAAEAMGLQSQDCASRLSQLRGRGCLVARKELCRHGTKLRYFLPDAAPSEPDEALDAWMAEAPAHRLVDATTAPPLAHRPVASVWEWGR